MADFKIKPAAGTGNKLILESEDGTDVLTTSDSGVTLASATLTSPTLVTPALGTVASGSMSSAVTGLGVQCAQQFMLTANKGNVTSRSDVTSDITEISSISAISSNTVSHGSLVSQSSGVFSFSKTGIYWLIFHGATAYDNDAEYVIQYIKTTINNSSYVDVTETVSARVFETGSEGYEALISQCFFDVTDTTNCKCKFSVLSSANTNWRGHATIPMTKFMFIRISDT